MTSAFQLKTQAEILDVMLADDRNTIEGVKNETDGDDFHDIRVADSEAVHKAQAALVSGLDQSFPQTATFENLVKHGRRYIGDPHAATKASGTATATGEDGAPWSEGAYLVHEASGQRYVTTAAGQIVGESGTAQIEAADGGAEGWLAPDERLIWESPPPNVTAIATVIEMEGGTAAETREQYLARLQDYVRNPEAGGTAQDFETWALETEGVGVATALPARRGPGTCDVAVLDFEGDPVSAGVLAACQTNLDAKRPCTSLGSQAVTPTMVDIDPAFRVTLDGAYAFSEFPATTVSLATASTDSKIVLGAVADIALGDWLAIPRLRQARQVTQVDGPGSAVYVSPAFSEAPLAGDAAIPGCPTYDQLAASVYDYGRSIKPTRPYYKDGGEAAVRNNIEMVSVRQLEPAGDVEPIVTESTVQAVRIGAVTLVKA